MVSYYTLHVLKSKVPLTKEQERVLGAFVSKYHARRIEGKEDIVLDFQYPTKLVPVNLRKELNGLEIRITQ